MSSLSLTPVTPGSLSAVVMPTFQPYPDSPTAYPDYLYPADVTVPLSLTAATVGSLSLVAS